MVGSYRCIGFRFLFLQFSNYTSRAQRQNGSHCIYARGTRFTCLLFSKEPMVGCRAVWYYAFLRDYGQPSTNHFLLGIHYHILRCRSIILRYKRKSPTQLLQNHCSINCRCWTCRGNQREPFVADVGIREIYHARRFGINFKSKESNQGRLG